jgi:ATP-dependent DNA helicase PIF1
MDTSLLSAEQLRVYQRFVQGHNLFVSGPGGSGKSFLIRYMVRHLYSVGRIHQVTSTTGCSSILLSSQIHVGDTGRPIVVKTIHSWSGIRLGKGALPDILRTVMKNRKAVKEWKRVRTLIIDEVSMLSGKLFTVLDTLGRTLRGVDRPFGGIQVVCLGDLYQLSPVGDYGDPASASFCFESPAWDTTFAPENHVELTTIYRQRDDLYKSILHEVRVGTLSEDNKRRLQERVKLAYCPDDHGGVVPMKIFATREQVSRINTAQYQRVEEPEQVYAMGFVRHAKRYVETGEAIPDDVLERCAQLSQEDIEQECQQLASHVAAEAEIRLKRGVPVMCLMNLDVQAGIANGSLGIVVDFVMGGVVAGSGGSGSGSGSGVEMFPVVRFYHGVVRTIEPYVWQSGEIPTVCVRQFPLALAYATSIHKMQGASLDVCEMDLGSTIFAEHQTYVALSRVRSLEGVYLTAFHPHRIRVNPKVAAFYARFGEDIRSSPREDTAPVDASVDDEACACAARIAAASGECPVCLDRLDKPHQTPCRHVFCHDCLLRHMQCTLSEPSCPMCRASISIYTIEPVATAQQFPAKRATRGKGTTGARPKTIFSVSKLG